jgi:hypothetical protein
VWRFLDFVAVAVYLVLAIAASRLASRRGRAGHLWLLYGLALPGISLIHALLSDPRGCRRVTPMLDEHPVDG